MNTQSLKKIISSLRRNEWDYYGSRKDFHKPKSFQSAEYFIRDYFSLAGKKKIFESSEVEQFRYRAEHVVSAFFIGAWLSNKMKAKAHFKKDIATSAYSKDFLFVWFLTCLYHDAKYYDELDNKHIDTIKCIDHFINKENIKNILTSTNHTPKFIPSKLVNSINKYFIYRLLCHNKIDHGISGGLKLFDKLENNRGYQSNDSTSGLDFSCSVTKFYREAAYAVATHNIYFPDNDDSKKKYQEHGLSSLINHPPITYHESPFLFLLGLVDTLEPVKIYECCNPDFVAHNVYFGFGENQNSFNLIIQTSSDLKFDKLKNRIDGIKNWLSIKCNNHNINGITIIIDKNNAQNKRTLALQ